MRMIPIVTAIALLSLACAAAAADSVEATIDGVLHVRNGAEPRDGVVDLRLVEAWRVGVVQEMPGKLIFVDRDGDPAGELRIGGPGVAHGGMCQTFSAFAGGDVLLVSGFVQSPGAEPAHLTQTNFLGAFGPDGVQTLDLCRTVNDIDLQDFTFDELKHMASYWWNVAIGRDGRIYVAPRLDRYEIRVFRDDGTLRVLTTRGCRGQAPGVMCTFDVFSPHGEFLRQVAVHHGADLVHDGVFLFGDDRAVIVEGFVDATLAQFTGGRMGIDFTDGEKATMEIVGCRID